jgi:hypothetical protein
MPARDPDGLPLVIDIDSCIDKVHGRLKHAGPMLRPLARRPPILAVRADTVEALHIRNQKGEVHTLRGTGGVTIAFAASCSETSRSEWRSTHTGLSGSAPQRTIGFAPVGGAGRVAAGDRSVTSAITAPRIVG